MQEGRRGNLVLCVAGRSGRLLRRARNDRVNVGAGLRACPFGGNHRGLPLRESPDKIEILRSLRSLRMTRIRHSTPFVFSMR